MDSIVADKGASARAGRIERGGAGHSTPGSQDNELDRNLYTLCEYYGRNNTKSR